MSDDEVDLTVVVLRFQAADDNLLTQRHDFHNERLRSPKSKKSPVRGEPHRLGFILHHGCEPSKAPARPERRLPPELLASRALKME